MCFYQSFYLVGSGRFRNRQQRSAKPSDEIVKMKKLITIIVLIMVSAALRAEPFTVLATSGLNVRKGPTSKSEKVGSLPFGTIVEAEMNYESDIDYKYRYKRVSEVIEGKQGFWIKIYQGKLEGYIFSGFGLFGEWIVNSTEINRDYRLLRVGPYCDAINYDPKLNWYALIKKDGKLGIKNAAVTLKLTHEFNEQDTLGQENEFWREFPLLVQSDQIDTVLFLIGTKNNLEEGLVFSQHIANDWGYSKKDNFLFPEQTIDLHFEKKWYQFRAFEGVKLTNENPEGYIKQYQIELRTIYPEAKRYNISPELQLKNTAEKHCNYRTPQLILFGDINKDGLPDFIYYSHTMNDSCGVCWEYYLFLSDKFNIDHPFNKVANEMSCSCIN